MPLDLNFIEAAKRHCDPYHDNSGTEHIALLLYSLVRTTRPRTVLEDGSGYSTLFLLRALADNAEDIHQERRLLLHKTEKYLSELNESDIEAKIDDWTPHVKERAESWRSSSGLACSVDPRFHEQPYEPHLYSREWHPPDNDYVIRLQSAIRELNLSSYLTLIHSREFSLSAIPTEAPIDLAWNDTGDYRGFFSRVWPRLNPAGGLILFHTVTSEESFYNDIQWMKQSIGEASGSSDLELLILEEPHKLHQNGCAILRRNSSFVPCFANQKPVDLWRSALGLLDRNVSSS